MMIQIHQKSIPTAQLQHRLVQGESNIEKVVFFVPNVPNIDFSVLIFTIKLLAEDAGKIVIGELDMDPTENGILLSWDVSKKYTRYGGGTRLQIDGADATGNIVYRALSEKFCMRKELTGEDAVQDPEPDPEAGYVPPIESGDNGKYLRAMNGGAVWGEVDHPKEIFWVELDTSAMKCSHSPTEILEAVNKGLFIMGRNTTTNSRYCYYCTGVDATFALFESYASEDKEVYDETRPGISVLRYEVNPAKKMSFKYSFVLSHKKLPNPFPLEFEGAVTGSYDGSAPMKIKIPTGGSGGGEKEIFWVDYDQTSRTASHSASEILEALKSGLLVLGRQGADISFVTGTTTSVVIFGQLFYSERNAGTAEAAPTIYYDQIVVKEDKSFYRNVFSVSQFDTLPNPFPLKFSGAVSGSYDGSSEFNLNIPAIPTIPDKLPNPNALTFTGAVERTYDGSEPLTVEIPEGGAGGMSSTAKALLVTILRSAIYENDQSANITALETALKNSGSGDSDDNENVFAVINSLTNISTSNISTTVLSGGSYIATLSADENYIIDSVVVTMGGTDITESVYSNGTITIPSVTGDIVITATAVSMAESGLLAYWDFTNGSLVDSIGGLEATVSETATHDSSGVTLTSTTDYLMFPTSNSAGKRVEVKFGSMENLTGSGAKRLYMFAATETASFSAGLFYSTNNCWTNATATTTDYTDVNMFNDKTLVVEYVDGRSANFYINGNLIIGPAGAGTGLNFATIGSPKGSSYYNVTVESVKIFDSLIYSNAT